MNIVDERGWCALFLAVENDHVDVVRYLLKNGADVNITNHFLTTCARKFKNARKV